MNLVLHVFCVWIVINSGGNFRKSSKPKYSNKFIGCDDVTLFFFFFPNLKSLVWLALRIALTNYFCWIYVAFNILFDMYVYLKEKRITFYNKIKEFFSESWRCFCLLLFFLMTSRACISRSICFSRGKFLLIVTVELLFGCYDWFWLIIFFKSISTVIVCPMMVIDFRVNRNTNYIFFF